MRLFTNKNDIHISLLDDVLGFTEKVVEMVLWLMMVFTTRTIKVEIFILLLRHNRYDFAELIFI